MYIPPCITLFVPSVRTIVAESTFSHTQSSNVAPDMVRVLVEAFHVQPVPLAFESDNVKTLPAALTVNGTTENTLKTMMKVNSMLKEELFTGLEITQL